LPKGEPIISFLICAGTRYRFPLLNSIMGL
jgi:hypothetical protein